MNAARTAAVIVTHRRPEPLARLLRSLAAGTVQPELTFVVDNAGHDPATRTALEAARSIQVVHVPNPGNPGPGAGWKRGMELALAQPCKATHVLQLDDDVVLPETALACLIDALDTNGGPNAGAAAPLLADSEGRLWAFPEPQHPAQRRAIRRALTPADCQRSLGPGPHPFVWCTGACVLYTRAALERCGLPRTDFQMLGEDLEFSMRIASRLPAVFVPDLVVPHLPPPPHSPAEARRSDRQKFLCLLQNLSYLAFHSPDSAHLRRYLAGNYRRWFRTHGWSIRNVRAAAGAFRLGALAGRPAGHPDGVALRARFA